MKTWGRRRGFSKMKGHDDELEDGEGLFLREDETHDSVGDPPETSQFESMVERNLSFHLEEYTAGSKKNDKRNKEGLGPRSASTNDLSTRRVVVHRNGFDHQSKIQSKPTMPWKSQELPVRSERPDSLFDPFDDQTCTPPRGFNPFEPEELSLGRLSASCDSLPEFRRDDEEAEDGNFNETACLSARGDGKSRRRRKLSLKGRRKDSAEKMADEFIPNIEEVGRVSTPTRKSSFSFGRKKRSVTELKREKSQPAVLTRTLSSELGVTAKEEEYNHSHDHDHHEEDPEGEESMNDETIEGGVMEKKSVTRQLFGAFSPRSKKRETLL